MTPARSITVFSHGRPDDTETALRRIVDLAGEAGVEVRLPEAEAEKFGSIPGTRPTAPRCPTSRSRSEATARS